MKEKNFIAEVARLSRQNDAEIEQIYNQGMTDLMNQVILPKIVVPTGQDIRGWRIHDEFMGFMAQFGEFIFRQSPYCYDVLAEIAMQRLSCGAVLHEPTPIFEALPEEYRKYSCAGDQPGLMSGSCWEFYRANARLMLERPKLHDHAAKIARGIITHSDDDGRELGGYMWGSHCEVKLANARQFCLALLDDMVDETFEHITENNWLLFIPFLKKHQEKINWKSFFKMLDITGLFQGKERRAIKKAICGRGI